MGKLPKHDFSVESEAKVPAKNPSRPDYNAENPAVDVAGH